MAPSSPLPRVASDSVVRFLRANGFVYQREAERVCIWRLPGTQRRANVQRRNQLEQETVWRLLGQAGFTTEEIRSFLSQIG